MVVEAAVSLVVWVGNSIVEGGKYVLNYFPQHYKYYMPGAILLLSLIFMALISFLILIIQSGGGQVLIGTNSVSGGVGVDGGGRLGQEGTGGGGSGTTVSTTGGAPTTAPNICGNGLCQNFQTSAKYGYEEALIPDHCQTAEFFYDIPGYCNRGVGLHRYIIYGASWLDPKTYQDAFCKDSIYAALPNRCSVVNNSIWYTENSQNCPEDCTGTYDCYYDYTCNDNPSNCGNFVEMECCSPGTVHEYECMDYGMCNYQIDQRPLSELKYTPVHCPCTSDAQCAGDLGGNTCCTSGSHTGFCYSSCA